MVRKRNLRWNYGALKKIRYSEGDPRVRKYLENLADDVADAANKAADGNATDGDGLEKAKYATSSRAGRPGPATGGRTGPGYQGRWRTTVITANAEAIADNAHNDTLLKALLRGKV